MNDCQTEWLEVIFLYACSWLAFLPTTLNLLKLKFLFLKVLSLQTKLSPVLSIPVSSKSQQGKPFPFHFDFRNLPVDTFLWGRDAGLELKLDTESPCQQFLTRGISWVLGKVLTRGDWKTFLFCGSSMSLPIWVPKHPTCLWMPTYSFTSGFRFNHTSTDYFSKQKVMTLGCFGYGVVMLSEARFLHSLLFLSNRWEVRFEQGGGSVVDKHTHTHKCKHKYVFVCVDSGLWKASFPLSGLAARTGSTVHSNPPSISHKRHLLPYPPLYPVV